MKKIVNFIIWGVKKIFNSKNQNLITPTIVQLYRQYATENFKIKSEIVQVKKGKRKYSLVFFETPCGKLRCNLGRHFETPLTINF